MSRAIIQPVFQWIGGIQTSQTCQQMLRDSISTSVKGESCILYTLTTLAFAQSTCDNRNSAQ